MKRRYAARRRFYQHKNDVVQKTKADDWARVPWQTKFRRRVINSPLIPITLVGCWGYIERFDVLVMVRDLLESLLYLLS